MAKYEFKVGDRVRFKEWDEMGKEFGFRTDRDINTTCLFKKEMRHFCGTYATIEALIPFAEHPLVILCNFTTNGNTRWNITPDMLKPASTKKRVDEPKKLETTYPTITAHIIEGNKTTVMLSDGRIGEVTCYYKDTFDPAVGVAEAYKKALDIAKAEDKPQTPKPKFEVSKKYATGTDLEGHKPDDSKKILMFDARHYGIIGTPTILKTSNGEPLFVGDQVQISSNSHTPDHLNMVCHNDKYNDFIMGIACDCRSNESIKDAGWSVNLVKRYTELKAGDNVEYTSKDFKVVYENTLDKNRE